MSRSNPLRESQLWEFNRLSHYQPTLEPTPAEEEDEVGPDSKLTIRAPPSASSALPTSLRLLFPEEEGSAPSNPFSIPYAQEPRSTSPATPLRAIDLLAAPSPRQGLPTMTLSATLPLQLTARPIKHDDSKHGASDVRDKHPETRGVTSAAKVTSSYTVFRRKSESASII